MSITDMVKDNKKAKFVFYRDKQLFYETECGVQFPIPIEDLGNATVNNTEKAILLMRYIRKHLKTIEENQ